MAGVMSQLSCANSNVLREKLKAARLPERSISLAAQLPDVPMFLYRADTMGFSSRSSVV